MKSIIHLLLVVLFLLKGLTINAQVVTWGNSSYGGDSSSVALELSNGVVEIYSSSMAFAALKNDGSVVTWGGDTWGEQNHGSDSSSVASELSSGVTEIYSTDTATTRFGILRRVIVPPCY